MIGLVLGMAAQASLASFNPHANELFDRDATLKAWALSLYDRNHDGWLTLYEAQPALQMFKEIADANRDGRVTTYEYVRAKEFIAARW
jgi:hypothetical protein